MRTIAKLLFLLVIVCRPAIAQTFVQGVSCSTVFGVTCTSSAMASNVTAGDAYLVYAQVEKFSATNNPLTIAITTSNSETMNLAISANDTSGQISSGNTTQIALIYLCNIVASPNAKPTFTATLSGTGASSNESTFFFDEYSSVKTSSCLDKTAGTTGSSGSNVTPWTGATITPAWTSYIVRGATQVNVACSPEQDDTPSWTQRHNSTTSDTLTEHDFTSASSVTPNFICSTTGTVTYSLSITADFINSSASAAGGTVRHKLIESRRDLPWPIFAIALTPRFAILPKRNTVTRKTHAVVA